jgi:hypothetical protein
MSLSAVLFYGLPSIDVQHDSHIKWCSCRLTVIRRVSLVEQELLTTPELLSSSSVFSVDHVATYLVFWVVFCRSLSSHFIVFDLVFSSFPCVRLITVHLVFIHHPWVNRQRNPCFVDERLLIVTNTNRRLYC